MGIFTKKLYKKFEHLERLTSKTKPYKNDLEKILKKSFL